MDRSVKSLVSVTLMVAALFVAMNRVVQNARLEDWWLVLALLGLAALAYFWEWRRRRGEAEALVEPGHSSLDGFRQVAPLPPAAAVIAPKTVSAAQADHDEIVKAYGEIRDTEVRSDVMASSSTMYTQEARATQGIVQNVTNVGATGTFEEVDEIAGGPVGSISKAESKSAPAVKAAASSDDLTIIEGIGPKMSAALKAAGIDTFAGLAQSSEAQIHAAIEAAGMRWFAPSVPTWAQQAGLAAQAEWEGLKKLQAKLKAGRKK